jgi:ABC-type multidrug transport system fused ATPase/permease subunit
VGAADKVFEWIEREPKLTPRGARNAAPADGDAAAAGAAADGRVAVAARGCVELRNVRFAYPTRPSQRVLQGVCLRAEPGEVLALCGASGGGKSSILALIQRWYDPLPRDARSSADGDSDDGGGGSGMNGAGGGHAAGASACADGAVCLDGVDVREYDSRWFHRAVSVVSQVRAHAPRDATRRDATRARIHL